MHKYQLRESMANFGDGMICSEPTTFGIGSASIHGSGRGRVLAPVAWVVLAIAYSDIRGRHFFWSKQRTSKHFVVCRGIVS